MRHHQHPSSKADESAHAGVISKPSLGHPAAAALLPESRASKHGPSHLKQWQRCSLLRRGPVACAVANFGSSFAIRPVNYFNQLASRTVFDVPWANITECGAPLQGIVDGAAQALG